MVRVRRAPQAPPSRAACRDDEAGAVAVEFALLFPLLFLMLFGTLIFGWRIWEHQAGQSTARQAARDAATGIYDPDVFTHNVICLGQRNGLKPAGLTEITVEYLDDRLVGAAGARYGGYVQVSVTSQSRLGAFPLISESDGTFTSVGLQRIEQLGTVTTPSTTTVTGVTCS